MTMQPDQSSNSVLTNVAPPSALPSFLASPIPANTPAPPPTPASTSTASPPPPLATPSTSFSSPTPAVPSSSTFVPSKVSSFPVPSDSPQTSMPPPPPVTNQPHTPTSSGSSASVDIGTPPPTTAAAVPPPSGGEGGAGPGWFGWIRGTVSNVGHRVAEKAKTSMDSMITTLDPQMKEFIYSGGDVDLVVASDKEVKVGAIREAFQISFGKATVCGMKAESEGVAPQPVGFEAALTAAEGRINSLRSSGKVHPRQPIIAVENFIVEFQTDCWFDLGLLLLDDPGEDIVLQTYTQVTPVPPDFVNQARSATPDDFPLKDSGFAVTVGQIASQSLQVHHGMWQEALTGVSRRECLVLAGRTLAGLYRSRLPKYH